MVFGILSPTGYKYVQLIGEYISVVVVKMIFAADIPLSKYLGYVEIFLLWNDVVSCEVFTAADSCQSSLLLG